MIQYAYIIGGKTIHSSERVEHSQNELNDKSIKVSSVKKCITTPDDHALPLNITSGLPYMNIRSYSDNEWNKLLHVILTLYDEWDPIILDYIIDDNDDWYNIISDVSTRHNDTFI